MCLYRAFVQPEDSGHQAVALVFRFQDSHTQSLGGRLLLITKNDRGRYNNTFRVQKFEFSLFYPVSLAKLDSCVCVSAIVLQRVLGRDCFDLVK